MCNQLCLRSGRGLPYQRDWNNSNQKLPHVLCDYPNHKHCQDLGSRSSDVILQKPVVVSRNVGHFLKLEETILQHSMSVFAYFYIRFLYSIFYSNRESNPFYWSFVTLHSWTKHQTSYKQAINFHLPGAPDESQVILLVCPWRKTNAGYQLHLINGVQYCFSVAGVRI